MNYLKLLIVALFFAAGNVPADPFEDGFAAYKRQDYATAIRLLQPLARDGNANAQARIGLMYGVGEGVTKDDQQAIFWSRKAAE